MDTRDKTPARSFTTTLLVLTALVALGVAGRLFDHAYNATPVMAAALFAGFFFCSRLLAVVAPLAIMLLCDAVIGFYSWPVMVSVYGCFALMALAGRVLRYKKMVIRTGGLAVTTMAFFASVVFFGVTNFAHWKFMGAGMYEQNLSGLLLCYENAIPFFKNHLIATVLWSMVLFGTHVIVADVIPANRRSRQTQSSCGAV